METSGSAPRLTINSALEPATPTWSAFNVNVSEGVPSISALLANMLLTSVTVGRAASSPARSGIFSGRIDHCGLISNTMSLVIAVAVSPTKIPANGSTLVGIVGS